MRENGERILRPSEHINEKLIPFLKCEHQRCARQSKHMDVYGTVLSESVLDCTVLQHTALEM